MSQAFSDLLIEIGTEELPPKALSRLSESFSAGVSAQLQNLSIQFGDLESFATPRRLAVLVRDVADRQPDREVVRRGPSVSAAFGADGAPTKAAQGFARSCGVSIEELGREQTPKGEWLVFHHLEKGLNTVSLVPRITEQALATLPIPKRMRWGDGNAEFVRPVHWVCLMYGNSPIEGQVLEVNARPQTRGHRFHHPDAISISDADQYAATLRVQGQVEPSFEKRREMIRSQVSALGLQLQATPEVDASLLDEVTALVEWPCAFYGEFDENFLAVPPEVLIETMRVNQKYFPLRRMDNSLEPKFIAVANILSREPEQVKAGNERVIRPRFSDAKFFWEQDLKNPLESLFPRLESVVFQNQLGSIADKSRRVGKLGTALAHSIGIPDLFIERAAMLAKCDLVSTMVNEFPALQGTMGRYYAEKSGEESSICTAMEEQYLPRFAGDALPASHCGRFLSVADRLDTLVGIFGIGERPSGTKDPYGLRRASIAVLRILIETPLSIDIQWAVSESVQCFPEGVLSDDTAHAVVSYMLDRLRGYYQEQGIAADTVDAVLAIGDTVPSAIDQRIQAVNGFRSLPAADSLAAANKRIRNILMKAGMEEIGEGSPESSFFSDPAEVQLWARIQELESITAPMLEKQDFSGVLTRLSELREQIDRFFDQVMVNADDPRVRQNRHQLLGRLMRMFLNVADISKLH